MRNHMSSSLIERNSIDRVEAMPSFNHTRGSIERLMHLSGVSGLYDTKINLDYRK